MRMTNDMRTVALEKLGDDPLAQKLVQAMWGTPVIGEYASGGKMVYTIGEERFSDAQSAYSHCVEILGRRLSSAARLQIAREPHGT